MMYNENVKNTVKNMIEDIQYNGTRTRCIFTKDAKYDENHPDSVQNQQKIMNRINELN